MSPNVGTTGGGSPNRASRRLPAALLALALLAGCAGPAGSGQGATNPADSPGNASQPVATAGEPASASPSPARTDATAEAFDLVWFSDSSAAFGQQMAQRIGDTKGVAVRLHDFWGSGGLGSATFIKDLIEIQAVEDALKSAEMIVLYANPGGTKAFDESTNVCFALETAPADVPKVPAAAAFADYADRLRAIYDRIFMLRGGSPVILRAVDAYAPVVAWKAAGVDTYCTGLWETWTTVARDVAAEYRVPMASMYDAFNGPGHDLDPVERGYIGSDGIHPNDAGRQAQVDVLAALGYTPVEPR